MVFGGNDHHMGLDRNLLFRKAQGITESEKSKRPQAKQA